MMKTTRFLLVLALASLIMACSKPDGDSVPNVLKSISVSIDSAGVFKITTPSDQGLMLDTLRLSYRLSSDSADTKLPVKTEVSLSKAKPYCDTIWAMEPQKEYCVCYDIREFFDAETVYSNENKPDTVVTCSPGTLKVTVDTAIMRHDTLCLQGTVTSFWRSLLKEKGYADMQFLWGSSVTEVNTELQAVPVETELDKKTMKLTVKIEGYLLKNDYQGLDKIYFKAHAKRTWGDGELDSGIRPVPIP